MPVNLFEMIARSEDRSWLITCRDHNARIGKDEVVKAVAQRLRDLKLHHDLKPQGTLDNLSARVEEALRIYEGLLEHKHGRRQAAGYTRRDTKRYGHHEALIRTIRRAKKTDGLKLLQEHGRLDCAYEQIAIDFSGHMPTDVVEISRRTLANLSVQTSENT